MIEVRGTRLGVDADPVAGYVTLTVNGVGVLLTVPQAEQLMALLDRARQVVSSGYGDMDPRP